MRKPGLVCGEAAPILFRGRRTMWRLTLLASALCAATAAGQAASWIAATVNDEVVSAYDVEARLRLVLFSTQLPDTSETRRRYRSQVLRSLIDERLQLQEAARWNVSVSERDIRQERAAIERRNNIPKGGLDELMTRNGVPPEAVTAQIRAGVAWRKLVSRQLRPRIAVGDEEIDEEIDRLRSRQGQLEYRLAEIVMAAERPDQEAAVREAAERLAEQLRQGAQFEEVARQFSQSATAAVGGDLGWVHESDLDDSLRDIVPGASKGALLGPLKALSGYRIVLLSDARKIAASARLNMRQLLVPIPADADADEVEARVERATELGREAGDCGTFEALARRVGSPVPPDPGEIVVDGLAPEIRPVVKELPAGRVSDPIRTPTGVLLLMVCSRDEQAPPDRPIVANRLLQRKMSLMARRYMRDLRLSAVIDLRN